MANERRLLEGAGVVDHFEEDGLRKIDFLSQYYLNARYKEDLEELSRQVGKDVAMEYIDFTKETVRWL